MGKIEVSYTKDMAFSKNVERWRPFARSQIPSFPTDFVLAWIKHESDGRTNVKTSLDERGIFQIHPSEAKGMGLSTAEFNSLLDPDQSLSSHFTIGAKFLKFKRAGTDRMLANAGINFSPSTTDYWKMVKLSHGLPAMINQGAKDFRSEHGRAPKTWAEFYTFIKDDDWRPGGVLAKFPKTRLDRVADNAENIGNFAASGLSGLSGIAPVTILLGAALIYALVVAA